MVTNDNGNNTFDITAPSGEYASVHSTELAFVRGQEVVGRDKRGAVKESGARTEVVASEGVTEVRWWE